MKRIAASIAIALVFSLLLPIQAAAATMLVPVGKVIGLQLVTDTVTVVAYDDSLGARARDAGLKIGDQIVRIDGSPVQSALDIRRALEDRISPVEITVRRGGKESQAPADPGPDRRWSPAGGLPAPGHRRHWHRYLLRSPDPSFRHPGPRGQRSPGSHPAHDPGQHL